ncbi:hypothetical protein F383_14296 [Gossypium arboreum]|uniref:Uncharacterized protein n=1 Tax=Gossypium arboreum TaxID=29729 RepID=A0A0B0NCF2_GOSAR|nr:hypothetical protein F383_14296 [Gossypium arboreum]
MPRVEHDRITTCYELTIKTMVGPWQYV